MFSLKTVSAAAAAAVHRPQQRADRYKDVLQATQMHTLLHKNMWQARVSGIAVWLQPKCFICQHDIIFPVIFSAAKEKEKKPRVLCVFIHVYFEK